MILDLIMLGVAIVVGSLVGIRLAYFRKPERSGDERVNELLATAHNLEAEARRQRIAGAATLKQRKAKR